MSSNNIGKAANLHQLGKTTMPRNTIEQLFSKEFAAQITSKSNPLLSGKKMKSSGNGCTAFKTPENVTPLNAATTANSDCGRRKDLQVIN